MQNTSAACSTMPFVVAFVIVFVAVVFSDASLQADQAAWLSTSSAECAGSFKVMPEARARGCFSKQN